MQAALIVCSANGGEMRDYISAIVAVVVLSILTGAAQRGKPIALPGTNFLLFRYSIFFRGFSLFAAFGIPIGITALVIAEPPTKQEDYVAMLSLYAMFGAISAPLLWESMRFAVVVGPEGLD